MDIIDYQIQGLKYLLPYFRTNEDITAVLKAICCRFNNLQAAISYLLNSLSIKNARGIWLDRIGTEVGAQRDEMDFGNYFCVNRLHLNTEKRFYFLCTGFDPTSPLKLSDAEFIQKIYAYIGANSSCGAPDEVISIIKTITNAENVFLYKLSDCTIKINLIGSALVLTRNTITYIQQILANGIYLEEIQINGKQS